MLDTQPTERAFEDLSETLLNLEAACEALPAEEKDRHRSATESVIRARKLAPCVEGQLWIS